MLKLEQESTDQKKSGFSQNHGAKKWLFPAFTNPSSLLNNLKLNARSFFYAIILKA